MKKTIETKNVKQMLDELKSVDEKYKGTVEYWKYSTQMETDFKIGNKPWHFICWSIPYRIVETTYKELKSGIYLIQEDVRFKINKNTKPIIEKYIK